MNQMVFADVIKKHSDEYPRDIHIPAPTVLAVPECGKALEPMPNFSEVQRHFSIMTFMQQAEIIAVYGKLSVECNKVAAMSLFQSKISRYVKLEEFQNMQSQASDTVQTYLRTVWVTECKKAIQTSLGSLSKGWFNLNETSQKVYEVSKLKKFLQQCKFLMHDTLRTLIQVV